MLHLALQQLQLRQESSLLIRYWFVVSFRGSLYQEHRELLGKRRKHLVVLGKKIHQSHLTFLQLNYGGAKTQLSFHLMHSNHR